MLDELLATSAGNAPQQDMQTFLMNRAAPIQLDAEELREYNHLIFPLKKQGVGGRLGLLAAVRSIHQVGMQLSSMMALARVILSKGASLEDSDKETVEMVIKGAVARIAKAVHTDNNIQAVSDEQFEQLMSGAEHVIQPSSRYKGGYDVVFSGLPNKSGARYSPPDNASIITDKTNSFYESESMANYKTPISLGIIEVCKTIIQDIFGADYNIENAQRRFVKQLPLDFDFEKYNSLITDRLGIDAPLFFKNVPKEYHVLSKYYSITLIIDPDMGLYPTWRRYLAAKETNATSQRPDNSEQLGEEGLWCNAAIRSTFALNLPKSICKYICQNDSLDLINYSIHLVISQWAKVYMRPEGQRRAKNERISVTRVPRYIVPVYKTLELKKSREEAGLHIDKGRTNADGLTVSPNGGIVFLPKSGTESIDVAKSYEHTVDKLLEENFKAGAPLHISNVSLNSNVFLIQNEDLGLDMRIGEHKKAVEAYKGALLSYSWDFNTVLAVGQSDLSVKFTELCGATAPDDLIIADMLGFDFKEEGETANYKTFKQFMHEALPKSQSEAISTSAGIDQIVRPMLGSASVLTGNPTAVYLLNAEVVKLFDFYGYYVGKKLLPSVDDLIVQTRKQMGLNDWTDSKLDQLIYRNLFMNNITLKQGILGSNTAGVRVHDGHVVLAALLCASYDALGGMGSNLYNVVREDVGPDNVRTEIESHPNYFGATAVSRLADFGNLYGYFGGRLFQNMCIALTKLDVKELVYAKRSHTDPDNHLIPSFHSISTVVMPLAVIFSKYVPDYLSYFEKAEKIYENNLPDSSIGVEDIVAPGIVEGTQVFPHQVKAHQFLRRRPKYAILDIHPGGGKTITGLLDIMAISNEEKDIKAIVFAPDKLCKNWCEDGLHITKGNWNFIPVVSSTFREWGPERLAELINNAPRNTVVVAGLNFAKSKGFNLSYGPRRIKVLGGVEFLKQFGFNYVLMDESHKAKRFNPEKGGISVVHRAVKEVFTMDSVRYARLATGTLVHGIMTDVVGQAALLTSYIYKTPETSGIDMNAEDAPIRIRSKLGKYAATITLKRKEWAFMLPNPINVFIKIQLTDGNSQGNEIHAAVYQAQLQKTLDKIKEAIKSGKSRVSEDGEDDDDTDMDDDNGSDDSISDADDIIDEDTEGEDDLAKLGAVSLQTYLQAIEQLVTDPWGDADFRASAEAAGIKPGDFTPAKIAAVIERLDRHFTVSDYTPGTEIKAGQVVNWSKGMQVKEYDVVRYEGQHYMRRALPDLPTDKGIERQMTPPSMTSPDKDPENWKPEAVGKVIIFCRYTRCVDAIFDALPERYKNKARRFHGEVGKHGEDKWENLNDFATDPNVEIFVANEQAIAEGHNLQMGSRIIRVDTPWSPGDYEQSTARIFRPDPKAAKIVDGKPGDMSREVIYIDWLMTEGTSEVAKVARLMWKTVDKTKFDEKGNPRYDVIRDISLDRIPMSLEILRDKSSMSDYAEYFEAKRILADIENREFSEMRRTTVAQMLDLEIPPVPSDFVKMTQFPIMPNQKIADTDGHGLVRFSEYAVNTPGLSEDLDSRLHLLPVRTGFGTGVVVGWTINYITNDQGERVPDPKTPVSNLKIRYKANDELVTHPVSNVFVATKVDASVYDQFFSTDMPWSTETERKRIEKQAEREQAKIDKQAEAKSKANKAAKDNAEAAVRTTERTKLRRTNIKNNKPVNEGVEKVQRVKYPKNERPAKVDKVDYPSPKISEGDQKLKLIPSVYNGFVSIHATNNDADTPALKKYGFVPHGEFLYIDFKNYRQYEAFLDWAENKYKLDGPTEKRLGAVVDTFEDTGRMGFNARLAAKVQGELQNFFRARHKENTDRKSIKMYAIVLHDRVRIVVDMATNPAAKRLVGTAVPGAGALGKWQVHPGMHVFFATNKRLALSKVKELQKAGFTITNAAKVIEAVANLKLK